jgi:hypothetical protein
LGWGGGREGMGGWFLAGARVGLWCRGLGRGDLMCPQEFGVSNLWFAKRREGKQVLSFVL